MHIQFYSFGVLVKMDKKCIYIHSYPQAALKCDMKKKSHMVISIKEMLP